MVEQDFVVEEMKTEYEGYFDLREVITLIDNHLRDKGYVIEDVSRNQQTKAEGRNIEIRKEPYKRITEYAKSVIGIDIITENMTDVVMEKLGKKRKLNQGKLKVVLWGWLETDLENRWEKKDWYWAVSMLVDKFVKKWHPDKYKGQVGTDAKELKFAIKKFLEMYKY